MAQKKGPIKGAESREKVVRTFDFLRPNKLSREHIRTLQLVMETFTRGMSTQLASQLRSVAQTTVIGIEQQTWDEYVRKAPTPSHVTILQLDPWPGAAIITLPNEISFTIAEMLMGGSGSIGGEVPTRSLTEIEVALVRSFIDRLLPEMRISFEPLAAIEPRVLGVDSNPQFAQIASSTDLVIVVGFRFEIDSVTADATMCIPWNTLAGVLEEISAQGQLANMKVDAELARVKMEQRVDEVQIQVAARMRTSSIRSGTILDLKVGDVLPLGIGSEEPLVLWAGDRPTYRAKAGKRGKKVAVEVIGGMLLDKAAVSGTNDSRGGSK